MCLDSELERLLDCTCVTRARLYTYHQSTRMAAPNTEQEDIAPEEEFEDEGPPIAFRHPFVHYDGFEVPPAMTVRY